MSYLILFESSLLIMLVYFLFYLMFLKLINENETMSSYECGFDPNSYTRMTFSYRFFLISILFIIFDVEISLMLPIPFLMMSVIGVWIFLFFIVILILGLLYEYKYGSLDWMDNIMFKA